MVFHWSLSDSKSPQLFRTLLHVLTDPNNAVVRMVSTGPLISKSSTPCTNPLMTVPSAPITIGITATVKFHSFFQFLSKVQVLISLFAFLQYYSMVCRDTKVHNSTSCIFLLTITSSGHLAKIRSSVCKSKSLRSLRLVL